MAENPFTLSQPAAVVAAKDEKVILKQVKIVSQEMEEKATYGQKLSATTKKNNLSQQ